MFTKRNIFPFCRSISLTACILCGVIANERIYCKNFILHVAKIGFCIPFYRQTNCLALYLHSSSLFRKSHLKESPKRVTRKGTAKQNKSAITVDPVYDHRLFWQKSTLSAKILFRLLFHFCDRPFMSPMRKNHCAVLSNKLGNAFRNWQKRQYLGFEVLPVVRLRVQRNKIIHIYRYIILLAIGYFCYVAKTKLNPKVWSTEYFPWALRFRDFIALYLCVCIFQAAALGLFSAQKPMFVFN